MESTNESRFFFCDVLDQTGTLFVTFGDILLARNDYLPRWTDVKANYHEAMIL